MRATPRSKVWRLAVASALAMLTLGAPLEAGQKQDSAPPVTWTDKEIMQAVAPVRAGPILTPVAWPNGARIAVCLSFDVDNETLSLAHGDTAPSTLSAGEFGATTGLPRILDLLDRHGIPATFYLPAVSAMLHPNMIPAILSKGRHEIGIHGWIHENLQDLDDRAEEKRLLTQSVEALTKAIGRRPVGFRAPQWAISPYTLGLLVDAGFLYDSSLMAMDQPYEPIANGVPTGLVELPVDWSLDDYPYFGRNGALPSPDMIFKTYQDDFDLAYEEGTFFMLTLHPQIIGSRSRIAQLDRLIAYMQSKPGVWFATGEQVATYVKAAKARQ